MAKFKVHLKEDSHQPDKKALEPHQTRYRWVMLFLVWLLYCVFGIVQVSIAPLVTPILRDLNIFYSQMGIILGSWPLTYIFIAVIGGAIIDRWGIRKSLFVGILIISLSASLRYFSNGFATMFLCVAMFGLGGPMISIGCPKTISVWFRGKERGTAVGVYMTGPSIGSLIALSLTNSVVMPLTGYSWRLTFVIYGLLSLAAAVLWWFLSRDVKPTESAESTSIAKVFTGLISIRNVQLILIMGALSFAISHGFSDWLPKILETGGLPPAIAGFAASIPILVGMPLVLTIPRLTPPRSRKHIVVFGSLVFAAGIVVVATTSGIPLLTGLALSGAARVCIMPILMLMLMDIPEVGSRYVGAAGGMFFCVAEIGGFAGPFILGAIKDLTGGFLIGVICLAGLAIVMSLMALLLKSQPEPET